MSRVTSQSRETTTRPRWADSGRNVRPRVLDEVEYSAVMGSQPDVDGDGDQYLVFAVPSSRYCSSPVAALAAGANGKTRVWRCIDNGHGGSDASTDGNRRDDGGGAALNGPSARDRLNTYHDHGRSNPSTSGRVRVETRLTSTGQSPSSPLSPSSHGLLSPVSRRSAIPVRVTPSSTGRAAVAGPATGAFSRRDVTRASMFERGSQRRRPFSNVTGNGGVRPHEPTASEFSPCRENRTGRPRSTSPPAVIVTLSHDAVTQPSHQHGGTSDTNYQSRGDENNNDIVVKASSAARQRTGHVAGSSCISPAAVSPVNNGVDHVTAAAAGDVTNDVDDDDSSKRSDSNIWDYRVTITDVADIIVNLGSSAWQDRRDGLASLQTLLRTDARLTEADLKKVTEIFTRMFYDPQSKVLSVFVETIVDLVAVHAADLSHWLPVLLPRLFLKLASDLRGSIHTKVELALQAVRENFDAKLQFEVIAEFMTEQAQTQCLKLKEATLFYVHELILDMAADELVNSSALQTLLLRVTLWSFEPQSNQVRKLAQAVIGALFNLKASELALAMTTQPKGIQDEVSRILKTHMLLASIDESRPISPVCHVANGDDERDVEDTEAEQTAAPHQRRNVHVTIKEPATAPRGRSRKSPTARAERQRPPTTTTMTQRPAAGRAAKEHVSGIPMSQKRPTHATASERGRHGNEGRAASAARETEMLTSDVDVSPVVMTSPVSPPLCSLEDVSDALSSIQLSLNGIPDELCIEGNAAERQRQWLYITCTLSDAAARVDVRKSAMRQLIDALPSDAASISQPAVKSLLLVLLSSTHADDEVSMLAIDCATMLLDNVVAAVPGGSCQLLSQLAAEATFPANLAALQILHARLDDDVELSDSILSTLVSCLLKAYEDDDRRVRKAGVDVLVKLYQRLGELLWTFIHGLSDAKVNFLRTRFRRAATLRLPSSNS